MPIEQYSFWDYFILIVGGVLVLFYLIYLPYSVIKSKKAINQLAETKPNRQLTLKEQQVLYLIYGKKLPIGPVFNIEGYSSVLMSKKWDDYREFLIGPYRVFGSHLKPFLQDQGNVKAEIYIHKKKAYLLSANDKTIIEHFAAQWQARFSPTGIADVLNIEITANRASTAEERQQLKILSIKPKRLFRSLGVFFFSFFSFVIFCFGLQTTPYFSSILPVCALPVLLFVYRYYRKCPFDHSIEKTVRLAQGIVVGNEGRKVWFSGSAEHAPEDPALCFIIPTERERISLALGQRVQFGFIPSPAVTPYLHVETTEEDYHPRIVFIDDAFDAGKEFSETPFIAWRYPYFALLLGLNPLLVSVPILLNSERSADYFAHWPFYLHLALGFFWLMIGSGMLLYRYWIYRRSKHHL